MALLRVSLSAIALATVSAWAGPASDLSYLASLAGKYPWEGAAEHQPSFFEVPSIKKKFEQFVPSALRKAITGELTTGTPNRVINGFFVVSGCKPHDCPSKNYIVLVRLSDGTAFFVVYDASTGTDDATSTRCFSSQRAIGSLPEEVKEEILLGHTFRRDSSDQVVSRNEWINHVTCSEDGSNQSPHSTATAGEAPASAARERRR
jgi:hypothetical protein